jgi:flagellar assembly factor FliW
MTLTVESSRFGTVQISEHDAIEFPLGLIGLEGSRYALLDRNPGTGFRWLQSLADPGLALPVVDPRLFFADFEPQLSPEERERIALPADAAAALYVTVRAAADPTDIVVNLRAPLLVWAGCGYQVLNLAPGAQLQAPLFAAVDARPGGAPRSPAVDAA